MLILSHGRIDFIKFSVGLPKNRGFSSAQIQYTRLPFGVTNGVSFFQRLVDELIEKYKLSGTFAYLDNITVSGVNKNDHDIKLNALLNAAKSEGLTFNDSKCTYCRTEIDLLGYRVSHNVIQPDPERLRPLLEMKCPNSKSELRRVIGMFSYYAKWVHNFSHKIRPLIQANLSSSFPLSEKSLNAFNLLRKELCSACLTCIKEGVPFVVECDASNHTLSSTLNQGGQPVAFHSRTFTPTEFRYSTVEKEAVAIIDAVRKWSHFLYGKRFTLLTDQQAVSYMFNPTKIGKIKNNKIQLWRSELGNFNYEIKHRPGAQNLAADALSRLCSMSPHPLNLRDIHNRLGHPGVTRLSHFIRSKNLPFSVEDVKRICANCRVCAELEPRFFGKPTENLIKSMRPWERISIDFKGPMQSKRPYVLFVVDEFSRFPFAFPCNDMETETVIKCLSTLFCLFGQPLYVHSDRGASFLSKEFKRFLTERGIASSKSTPYHPTGNSQCERINQTVWKTVRLLLRTYQQPESTWEAVLPEALHSVRSLLCTATNATPHERFLGFDRRSMVGRTLPNWLIQPGPVLLRRFVRNKHDPLVDEVELLDANPSFANVRLRSGNEVTVSVSDLAPCPSNSIQTSEDSENISNPTESFPIEKSPVSDVSKTKTPSLPAQTTLNPSAELSTPKITPSISPVSEDVSLRRSSRIRKAPDRFGNNIYDT